MDRFWTKVKATGGCWEWQAYIRYDGYGQFRTSDPRGMVKAHRMSWELVNGPIPKGMLVCHKCDNPRCVAPHHLFLGTHQDNSDDKHAKGRARSGNQGGRNNGNSKLTEDDVRAIRKDTRIARLVAADYGVHRATISYIRQLKTWADIK